VALDVTDERAPRRHQAAVDAFDRLDMLVLDGLVA